MREADQSNESTAKRRKTKGKARIVEDEEDLTISSQDDENDEQNAADDIHATEPRRSGRSRNLIAGVYQDDVTEPFDANVEMAEEALRFTASPGLGHLDPVEQGDRLINVKDEPDDISLKAHSADGASSTPIEIDLEIEEEKPKPMLQLKYRGFSIYGHCLCIVVEPWPSMRFSRAPSVNPPSPRAQSIAPPDFVPANSGVRARTPLFLPDDSDRDRSETPAPFLGQRILPPVPLFNDWRSGDSDDDSDGGGMMEYSQVLSGGGDRAGAAEDEEDIDGAAFFGDADEIREL